MIAERWSRPVLHLDLERPSDLAKLADPEQYLEHHAESLVILDEAQRRPDLFPVLRALADADPRNGRFLILGSASPGLVRQSSETLAGRIVYHELSPISLDEIGPESLHVETVWRRGGCPLSLLASSDADSLAWREAFVQTHLERDIPNLGFRTSASALRRFWQMLAHCHGQLWNAGKIAGSLGVAASTVRRYLDILQDTFMIRQLQPFHPNVKKRLVKKAKIYLRDSGLLHALLRIQDHDDLLGHPIAGASWEGWVVEQILAVAPPRWEAFFYRTQAGAEMDLVLDPPGGGAPVAVEIKNSLAPVLTRGFWSALEDLRPARAYVVYAGREHYPMNKGVHALPVTELHRITET